MATQSVSGSSSLTIGPGQTQVTSTYTATKVPAAWSVSVISDGALSPGDYTVTISSTGVLTITLNPGVSIPPGGVNLIVSVTAVHSGGGVGNIGSLTVTTTIDENAVPCFVEGTLIDTPEGERRIEDLCPGDTVLTLNDTACIRHVLRRKVDAQHLAEAPNMRPVRIKAEAFGDGRPHSDLLVSPFHRILLGGWVVELLFGKDEAFAHAMHLINDRTIVRDHSASSVTYFHLVFDHHEIVRSNGLFSESLHLGNVALRALNREDYQELESIFPDAAQLSDRIGTELARSCLTRREAAVVAKMH